MEAKLDKRILDAIDVALKARLEDLSHPIPPSGPPMIHMPDGRVVRYTGPWNPNWQDEDRVRTLGHLSKCSLLHAYLIDPVIHAKVSYLQHQGLIPDFPHSSE